MNPRGRLVLPALVAGLVLTGCSGPLSAPDSEPTATTEPVLVAPTATVPYDQPVTVQVRDGTLESVTVTAEDGEELGGTLAEDGSTWISAEPPLPGTGYGIKRAVAGALQHAPLRVVLRRPGTQTMRRRIACGHIPQRRHLV